jgi:hypothetical protein
MSQRSRRIWFGVAIVALIGLAALVNFMGDGIVVTMKQMHGHP